MSDQHTIPDPPPITDAMTQYGVGISSFDLLGERIVTTYNIPDSDRREILLFTESGRTLLISCDPIVHDDEGVKLPSEEWGQRGWDVVLYDATDTEAGRIMPRLAQGEWL